MTVEPQEDKCRGAVSGEHFWADSTHQYPGVSVEFKTCLLCGRRIYRVWSEWAMEWSEWRPTP